MEKELYIVCPPSEQEKVDALKEPLAEKGFTLRACNVTSDPDTWDGPVKAEYVALWLTPQSDSSVFQVSSLRLNSGKQTVNIFPGPMSLTEEKKRAVGKNKSVFSALHPSGIITDLCSVLPEPTPQTAAIEPVQTENAPSPSVTPTPNPAPATESEKKEIPWKTILWVVLGLLVLGVLFG